MAGYFEYVGKIFTEKGSWYKLLTLVALQVITIFFNPQLLVAGLRSGEIKEFNYAALILYLLCAMLIWGFTLQVYSGAMKRQEKILPDIDFADMFVRALKFIPFGIVWAIYFVLYMIIPTLAFSSLVRNSANTGISALILGIVFFALLLVLALTFNVVLALHAKRFSYKNVLNPFLPFMLFGKVGGSVFVASLLVGLTMVLLYGILITFCFMAGFAGAIGAEGASGLGTSTLLTIAVVLSVFFYVQNAVNLAFVARVADITLTKLEDTAYLNDDFDNTEAAKPKTVANADNASDDDFIIKQPPKDESVDI